MQVRCIGKKLYLDLHFFFQSMKHPASTGQELNLTETRVFVSQREQA